MRCTHKYPLSKALPIGRPTAKRKSSWILPIQLDWNDKVRTAGSSGGSEAHLTSEDEKLLR